MPLIERPAALPEATPLTVPATEPRLFQLASGAMLSVQEPLAKPGKLAWPSTVAPGAKLYTPVALVTALCASPAVQAGPALQVIVAVTPARPVSPASRMLFMLASLNTVPVRLAAACPLNCTRPLANSTRPPGVSSRPNTSLNSWVVGDSGERLRIVRSTIPLKPGLSTELVVKRKAVTPAGKAPPAYGVQATPVLASSLPGVSTAACTIAPAAVVYSIPMVPWPAPPIAPMALIICSWPRPVVPRLSPSKGSTSTMRNWPLDKLVALPNEIA